MQYNSNIEHESIEKKSSQRQEEEMEESEK